MNIMGISALMKTCEHGAGVSVYQYQTVCETLPSNNIRKWAITIPVANVIVFQFAISAIIVRRMMGREQMNSHDAVIDVLNAAIHDLVTWTRLNPWIITLSRTGVGW